MVFAVVMPERSAQNAYADFVESAFNRLADQCPTHRFFFIGSAAIGSSPAQVHWMKKPRTQNRFSRWWWYQLRLPRLLKTLQADHCTGTEGYIAHRSPCAQSLLLPQVWHPTTLHRAGWPGAAHFRKAKNIAVFDSGAKAWLVNNRHLSEEKITMIPVAVSAHFVPLESGPIAETQDRCTGGAAYFLATGIQSAAALITLLKAFSRFKKRQKSSMKLAVAVPAREAAAIDQQLARYRYRQDVVIWEAKEIREEARAFGSAYAVIVGDAAGAQANLVKALQCQVPLLTISAHHSSTGAAALYFNKDSDQELSEQMMLVYKDENIRNALIEKGKPLAAEHTWEKCTAALWHCITGE